VTAAPSETAKADFAEQRDRMVEVRLARGGIRNQAVLAAKREVSREPFAPEADKSKVLEAMKASLQMLKIGDSRDGQTLLGPLISEAQVQRP